MRTAVPFADGRRSAALFATVELLLAGGHIAPRPFPCFISEQLVILVLLLWHWSHKSTGGTKSHTSKVMDRHFISRSDVPSYCCRFCERNPFWHCLHSMWSRVYVVVGYLSHQLTAAYSWFAAECPAVLWRFAGEGAVKRVCVCPAGRRCGCQYLVPAVSRKCRLCHVFPHGMWVSAAVWQCCIHLPYFIISLYWRVCIVSS